MGNRMFKQLSSTAAAVLLGAIVFAAGAFADTPAPAVKKLAVESPTHLLFVGNSYLYYGDSTSAGWWRLPACMIKTP